ncbi:MAG: peroxiredoxin [Magnetococcales bacterium]|nr:peroxiredoxin [Magnetococcales bacterium]
MLLAEGTSIPDLSCEDQNGDLRSLKELIGEKGAVFYFYPKDNTPGCTTEAKDFQEMLQSFSDEGLTIIGISKDSVKSHTNFCTKHELTFTLLSDKEGALCEAFGVWQEKKNYGRTYMGIVRSTFIVDHEGIIKKSYAKVRVKEHVAKVRDEAFSLLGE